MTPRTDAERITRIAASLALAAVVGGCAAAPSARPAPTAQPRVFSQQQTTAAAPATDGSLWPGAGAPLFLFQDTKAGRVGDVVTVRIVENAQGSKGAKTAAERSSTVTAGTDSFLGIPAGTANRLQADASFAGAFDGSGATSRSGALTADVTATVTQVLPNGNMAIEGWREVLINDERERIWVSGVIRPQDIGPRNRVLSTVIADARIEYTGAGVVSDTQRPGWLVRILDWIWPF
ncbi:MAG: flagellar basal body L-ring protein FlgH [Nitrospirota bacterium]